MRWTVVVVVAVCLSSALAKTEHDCQYCARVPWDPWCAELASHSSLSYVPGRPGNPWACEHGMDDAQYCTYAMASKEGIWWTVPAANGAICAPKNCTVEDVKDYMEYIFVTELHLNISKTWPAVRCGAYEPEIALSDSWGTILLIVGLGLLALIVLTSSTYDEYVLWAAEQTLSAKVHHTEYSKYSGSLGGAHKPLLPISTEDHRKEDEEVGPSVTLRLARCFSVRRCAQSLFATKKGEMGCLNGIRVISMLWVILGHALAIAPSAYVNSELEMHLIKKRLSFQIVTNAVFSVDTFFWLSGFLVTALCIPAIKSGKLRLSNWYMYYVHREIRLLPVYGLAIAAWACIFPRIPSMLGTVAPYYHEAAHDAHHSCSKYWWTNLLWINNMHPHMKHACMGWSWYMAIDTQLYFLAPILMVILARWLWWGIGATTVCVLGAMGATLYLEHEHKYDVSIIFAGGKSFDNMYERSWVRCTPFLLGMIAAALWVKLPRTVWRMHRVLRFVVWAITLAGLSAIIFTAFPGSPEKSLDWSLTSKMMYKTFSRIGWGIGMSIVAIMCLSGQGGYINSFLAADFWQPWARVTFTAYMVHPMIIIAVVQSQDWFPSYSDIMVAPNFVAYSVLAYAIAGLVGIFIEKPIMNLERCALPQHR